MIWVTADDVILIHSRIIQTTGGIEGLRDRAGLEAAIAAPLQSFGGEDLFPSDIEKVARIGFGFGIEPCVSRWQQTYRRHDDAVAPQMEWISAPFETGRIG